MFHAGNLINWASVKQTLIALSTCEAEINSIVEGAKEAIYFRDLLSELCGNEMNTPTTVFNDNRPAHDTLESGGKHSRTKHFKRKIDFVRNLEEQNVIKVQYMSITEMLADLLTKPLPEEQLFNLLKKSGMNITFD